MLDVSSISKTYEGQLLLKGVSFSVQPEETICLLGPSGSGKSTLLRIIAGIEQPEQGRVLWQGQDVTMLPIHKRQFGLMFQDYALFPHKNVFENIAFGLRMQNLPAPEIRKRTLEALDLVNLAGFERRRVTDLSGGEQQRVALARALVPGPRLLMLDEPLGALDRTLREELTQELRRVLHTTGIPAIYVTHDQEEAFTIADRLLLLHDGRVIQQGSPAEVYNSPVSAWVAAFLGLTNLLPGEVLHGHPLSIRTAAGDFDCISAAGLTNPPAGSKLTLLIRPDGASLSPVSEEQDFVEGLVEDCFFRAGGYRVHLRAGGVLLQFYLEQSLRPGQTSRLFISPGSIQCLPPDPGK